MNLIKKQVIKMMIDLELITFLENKDNELVLDSMDCIAKFIANEYATFNKLSDQEWMDTKDKYLSLLTELNTMRNK